MRPRRLQVRLVEAHLKSAFRHAAHERRSSQSVLVALEGDNGQIGWGEALPRDYVTGESPGEVFHAIAERTPALAWPEVNSAETLAEGLNRLADSLFPQQPSARCAVELAHIDLAARSAGIPAQEVVRHIAEWLRLPLRHPARPVIVSGVIGAGPLREVTGKALRMRLFGLRQIKVKVGSDLAADLQRLRRLRRVFGRRVDLRVDANGAWTCEEAIEAIQALSEFGLSSVEQPLAKGDEANLPRLRRAVDVAIALDESLTSLVDAQRAIESQACDLFNIRLSKCGGVVTALRILAEAQRAGLGAWLGCMVGESGFLSAAGRAVAHTVEGLRHLEGSYDRQLFNEHLAVPPVSFGWGGRAKPIPGPGWGLLANLAVLDKWTLQRHDVELT